MNRNSENHFAVNPQVDIGRSCFKRNSDHKTTFDAGDLVPIYVDEVLPGDTFSMDMSALVRMTTPIFPTMDNAAIDFYFFYTPTRILWDHWKELNGENRETAWAQKVEYSVPQLKMTKGEHPGGWDTGTIADYMGIPTKVTDISVNALPFRAYGLIWNEFFRNQNTSAPTLVETDDRDIEGTNDGSDSNKQAIKGGKPLPAEKYFDYFTGCLPAPQKGEPVNLPMSGNAPVKMYSAEGQGINGPTLPANIFLYQTNANASQLNEEGAVRLSGTSNEGGAGAAVSRYLAADLKNITGATINQLRQAFQIQKLLEKDARGGTRYREVLRQHFGVISPDSRQQVPEYLGGYRMPINVNQVVQTSQTSSESPQGKCLNIWEATVCPSM